MPQQKPQHQAIRLTNSVRHASAVAETAMAVNAASALTVLKGQAGALNLLSASQTALRLRLFLKIQYKMRFQLNKYGRKKLLNL